MGLITFKSELEDGDEFDEVYSGYGCMAGVREFIEAELDLALRETIYVAHLREQMSISGAMRWPWSQEAVIVGNTKIRVI